MERAEWVLVGYRNPDGTVSILASGELIGLELSTEPVAEVDDAFWFEPVACRRPSWRWWVMTARLGGFSWAKGAHYGEAFAKLFGTWNPDAPPPASPAEVSPGRRALDYPGW